MRRTCSITRVCRSSQSLSDENTLLARRCAPYTFSIPGQRMSSGVVKHFTSELNLCQRRSCGKESNDHTSEVRASKAQGN